MRTISWENNTLTVIDQRKLPGSLEVLVLNTTDDVSFAIRDMVVRGAPAIGAVAAFGLALAARESKAQSVQSFLEDLRTAKDTLKAARPTAVNLSWALERVCRVVNESTGSVDELSAIVLQEAQRIADEDVETNKRMGRIGADLIEDGDTIIHHCNTGALAVVDWGTALGVIRCAHEQGKKLHILVDETRPRLQGARLTAWELKQYGISFEIICDNMAGYYLRSGEVKKVLFGADRIAKNGDVANKIGSYMLALAAHDNNVPVYSVAPTSTIDLRLSNGDMIPIEQRESEEVLGIQYMGERIAPEGSRARNPAFDVTPQRLISAIVTEKGIIRPPYEVNLKIILNEMSA